MTLTIKVDGGSSGISFHRLENMDRPAIAPPGVYIFRELGGRTVMDVPFSRVISIEYEDNVVTLVEKLV